MEIRRFGVGYRRHEGPSGTHGVDGQSIHADRRGTIAELAFRPNAAIAPHSNPNLTYFVVIEGGGFVQVGEERARVAAGEAVVWPPDVVHAAWTERTPMRAIVVEFALDDPGLLMLEGGVGLEAEPDEKADLGRAADLGGKAGPGGEAEPTGAAGGGLVVEPRGGPGDRESPEREPW
jgi:quercetin dioxygenase-like cupin family protein